VNKKFILKLVQDVKSLKYKLVSYHKLKFISEKD